MNDYIVTENIRNTLGEYAKKVREEKKLGLNQFCIKVDIQPSLYSRFENGKVQKINPFLLKKIAFGLEIDYKDLYKIVGYLDEEDFKEITALEKENQDLKQKLQDCESKLAITHNGVGQIVVGNNNQIGSSKVLPDEFDLGELSEERMEELRRFIKYLKNS